MPNHELESTEPEVGYEIEHGHAAYTDAELLDQSQLNAQSLVLATFEAIGDDQELLDRMVDRIAATFANAWDTDREWQPAEVLDSLLTNFRSFGGSVESQESDDDTTTAVVSDLPSSYLCEILDVSQARFLPMMAICERLVRALGCEFEWSHDTDAGQISLWVRKLA
ncbi:MAG: hypothetical protein M3451_01410 [Chloroflexota bacterium]|nr:hypothetical protein [Chloroflexota bacterium]